jgi:glutamate synthase (NADPH/NADH) large chain
MSGGIAYVVDEAGDFAHKRCNHGGVDLEPLVEAEDIRTVRTLIERHLQLTGSPRAQRILANWTLALPQFIKVFPREYRRVLEKDARMPDATATIPEPVAHG